MMHKMWLCTQQFGRWVKVHSPGSEYAQASYSERLDYLNGGVGIRTSWASHGERTLTWNRVTQEEAREIADFADGMYGNGPFYLIDPVSATQNVLTKHWATPALGVKDGIRLRATGKEPILRTAGANMQNGFPLEEAEYTFNNVGGGAPAYIPIPPGHVAWVGVHGNPASTGGITVQPNVGGYWVGVPTLIPVASPEDDPLFSHSFAATPGSNSSGIELSLQTDSETDVTVSLSALIVQIHPAGVTPTGTKFISGQGISGFSFEGKPQITPYSTYHDQFGLSAKIVETEPWL